MLACATSLHMRDMSTRAPEHPSTHALAVRRVDILSEACALLRCLIPAQHRTSAAQTFATKDFPTFPDAVDALTQLPGFRENSPRSAAFAVAGPVAANRCEMTNLSWVIDGVALTQKYGVR